MGRIGPAELAILAAIALVLFGGSRVADLGRGMGEAIRNFKRGLEDSDEPRGEPAAVAALPTGEREATAAASGSGVESPPAG